MRISFLYGFQVPRYGHSSFLSISRINEGVAETVATSLDCTMESERVHRSSSILSCDSSAVVGSEQSNKIEGEAEGYWIESIPYPYPGGVLDLAALLD